MLNKIVCTTALLAALPLSAPAATLDYFLKIDGAPGESQDSKHKNEIDVLSWSWGASRNGASTVFDPFAWEQGLDSSYGPLVLGLVDNTHFKTVALTVRRAGKEPQEFFKMTLSDARVVSLSSQGSGDSILVQPAISYDAVAMRYCPQKADGSLGTCVQGGFTVDHHGKLSFSGDARVLGGLVEAGGSLNFVNQVPEPASWASLAAGLVLVAGVLRRRRPAARPGLPRLQAAPRGG